MANESVVEKEMVSTGSRGRLSRGERRWLITGVPIVVFTIWHIAISASVFRGDAAFARWVGLARLPLVRWFVIFFAAVVILIHAARAVLFFRQTGHEGDSSSASRRPSAMELTGFVTLIFLGAHFYEFSFRSLFYGLRPESFYATFVSRLSSTWFGVPWIAIFYATGVLCASAYLGMALWTVLTRMGGMRTEVARRRGLVVATLTGFAFALWGANSVLYAATGSRLFPETTVHHPTGTRAGICKP